MDIMQERHLILLRCFATVQKYYEGFRRNIALYEDEAYQHNSHRVTGYDEYLYLPKSLKVEGNIGKLTKAQSTITQFWNYFETFILQYKGVSDEQFVFYLKEAEWRFNTHDFTKN